MSQDQMKQAVAQAAVELLPDGPLMLGIGTGSTMDLFIDALAASGRMVAGTVASSARSAARLSGHGIAVLPLSSLKQPLALYIDGADEIEPGMAMIKGGGAALTQEKIVASASRSFLCIVDASKQVARLGQFPLPVEVIASAVVPVCWALEAMGGQPLLREGVLTDNGHPILDVHGLAIDNPLAWEDRLNALPGVVTNGIFARQRASMVLVGRPDGILRLPAA
ncbi:MAG: ribose-5-phosphate isomerase RpiA [Burkholderiaceae bacterium]